MASIYKTPDWMTQTLADLVRHEGFREFAYPDPLSSLFKKYKKERWGFVPAMSILEKLGVSLSEAEKTGAPWTIGIGFTKGVTVNSQMKLNVAMHKLEDIVLDHLPVLDKALPEWQRLPLFAKTVVVNMAFNMGSRLLQFKNSMGLIGQGKYAQAASSLRKSAWARQVGQRAVELTARLERQAIDPKHRVV